MLWTFAAGLHKGTSMVALTLLVMLYPMLSAYLQQQSIVRAAVT